MSVVVLGAGESGVGAALLAKKKGLTVFVSDRSPIKLKYKKELIEHDILFEEGQHSEKKIFEASIVIKSPGIPDKVDLIRQLHKRGIPVISEIEFAGRYTEATIIGITGSNGKTTTTNLTYHLLKNAGLDVAMGGNVGYSFARLLTEAPRQIYVLELSSFQLDGIRQFRPDIAVLLNITPDHLDRYDYQMEKYIAAKFRIAMNQQENDYFIINGQDENIEKALHDVKVKSRLIAFRMDNEEETIEVDQRRYDLRVSNLHGKHNAFNAKCAVKIAHLLKADTKAIQGSLNSFENDPHRLEKMARINEVDYINDSKATNVDAVSYALDAMKQPVVWIAGGTDKGNDYEPIAALVEEKVKAIVCLGIDNQKLIETFSPVVKIIEETQSAHQAVERASLYAQPGDVVLLSPACASFDLFRNYMDRGDQFKQAVYQLQKKN